MRFRLATTPAAGVALASWLFAAVPGAAAGHTFEAPTVDYSADMVRDASGVTRTMKIYCTPDKTRSEIRTANHTMIGITDRTKHEVISMDPEKHTYFKMDLGPADVGEAAMSTNDYTTTFQGEEIIDGIRTSKYLYEGTTNGTSIKGTVWVTSDHIPVRNVATVITAGQTISVNSHLENLKVEKLDPGLFEVPAGYVAREMPTRGARH